MLVYRLYITANYDFFYVYQLSAIFAADSLKDTLRKDSLRLSALHVNMAIVSQILTDSDLFNNDKSFVQRRYGGTEP